MLFRSVPMVAHADSSGKSSINEGIFAEYKLGSILCAPVTRTEDMNSVLFAGRAIGEPFFSEADLEVFSILARQAEVALENARLYAELRDNIDQVEKSQRALIQAEKMREICLVSETHSHSYNWSRDC